MILIALFMIALTLWQLFFAIDAPQFKRVTYPQKSRGARYISSSSLYFMIVSNFLHKRRSLPSIRSQAYSPMKVKGSISSVANSPK
jgi:hypothetical protein